MPIAEAKCCVRTTAQYRWKDYARDVCFLVV